MTKTIDPEILLRTLQDLVRIDSVNPRFSGGRSDESALAAHVERELVRLGLEVLRREPQPGRVSLAGRLRGEGGGPCLILYAHLDTVGVEGMSDPFSASFDGTRLHGRGAYDMKGGLAACLAAVRAIRESGMKLDGDVILAAVADEEAASLGMIDLLEHVRADAAIVTEPTELDVCIAHKGFAWLEVEVRGRAAHGSRWEDGIDANRRMGRVLRALDELETSLQGASRHKLLGPPSLHVGLLGGGTGESTYAAISRATVERRLLPGETAEQALAEVQGILERLRAGDASFDAGVRVTLSRAPFEAQGGAQLLQVVEQALEGVLGSTPRRSGVAFWTDAALLQAAGVDTLILGPAGAGAHAAEEWVDVDSVLRLAQVLAWTAEGYCGSPAR